MEQDIHKLGAWLERVCQKGIATENELREEMEKNGRKTEHPEKEAKPN